MTAMASAELFTIPPEQGVQAIAMIGAAHSPGAGAHLSSLGRHWVNRPGIGADSALRSRAS